MIPLSDKALLEFIVRLAYNVEGLPGELKVYFSQFLTFHFSKGLSQNQIQDIENKRSSHIFSGPEEIAEAAAHFSIEDKIWTIASIQILQSQAEKIDNRIVWRRIDELLKNLIAVLALEGETARISEERRRIEDEIYQFQTRSVVKISASIWPLTLDYFIRWILLLGFSYLGIGKEFLTGFNIFLIPTMILIIVFFVRRSHRKFNKKLLGAYGEEQQFKIVYQVTTGQYTWLAFYLGTSVFISYLLPNQLHLLTLFGLLFYYFIYLRFFRLGKLEENNLAKQLESKTISMRSLNVDENDEVIVGLETKLNSSTSRLEAYVLESALFGALSFSGFLQIMATELITFADLENFATYIFTTSQAFINFDWQHFEEGIAGLSTKSSLFCLVSVESLVCSIFFLAVIASRLRFSDITDRVRTAINMAKVYNEKEENIHDAHEITGRRSLRLDALTAKVNEQLQAASVILEEINPVMNYMEYFRNAGILVFIIILISSSLFITVSLGWVFITLVLATYLYFNLTTIGNKFKATFFSFRIQFIKQGYWFVVIAIFLMTLAYVLRIFFHIRETDFLFPVSSLLIGFYVFTWLILAAHIDDRFGEIEMDLSRQKRWSFIKNTVAILFLFVMIGISFKQLYLVGANAFLLISLLMLAILMYFVGYYLSKIRWLGILYGGILAIASVGLLFKRLYVEGANAMIFVALIALLILIPFAFWKRHLFHRLLIRFCVVSLIVCIWYSHLFYIISLNLEISYAHETLDTGQAIDVVLDNNYPDFVETGEPALDKGIKQCDRYIQEYGTRNGFTFIHNHLINNYNEFAIIVLLTPEADTTSLNLALKAVREEFKVISLFNFDIEPFKSLEHLVLESDLLLAMGKREEAVQWLEKMLSQNPPQSFRKVIIEKLANINSTNSLPDQTSH